jgi:hypothetical protein
VSSFICDLRNLVVPLLFGAERYAPLILKLKCIKDKLVADRLGLDQN